jgi:Flp pilus assembly protein TadG
MPRGQALVEFALILPLLLLLTLGSFQVGVALMARYELGHAVTESAIVGATEPAQPQRCDAALAALAEVYGPDRSDCTATDLTITVSAGIDLPLFVPWFTESWAINADATAIRR